MSTYRNKLFADYNSNHIIMVHPSMYENKSYYKDLMRIYVRLHNIFKENNIKQTIVLNNMQDSNFYSTDNQQDIQKLNYECDDIWIRDYYPKFYAKGKNKIMISYDFNAYGKKYAYQKDKKFKEIFNYTISDIDFGNIALEGGNLEFSSEGVVITNINSIKQNNHGIREEYIKNKLDEFKDKIGIAELYMLDVDEICGDDTNGHIDNLVRFLNDDTIVYFASKDKNYCNYEIACKLEKQINIIIKKSKIINKIIPIFHTNRDTFIKNKKIYPYSKLNFISTKDICIFPSLKDNHNLIYEDIHSLPISSKIYILNSEAALLENGGLHCLTANT